MGELIDLIGSIGLGHPAMRARALQGQVYEYCLQMFALAEGKRGGQFYTPRKVVELPVAMLRHYKGRVFDPCCGSGGMFVQSERLVLEHQGAAGRPQHLRPGEQPHDVAPHGDELCHPRHRSQPRLAFAFNAGQSDAFSRRQKE